MLEIVVKLTFLNNCMFYTYNMLYRRPTKPTTTPTHGEKTVSLTRVPGAPHHVHARPSRPRTAPGPTAAAASKSAVVTTQPQPTSKLSAGSSITGAVLTTKSGQEPMLEGEGGAPEKIATSETGMPPKHGAICANRSQVDHGKPLIISTKHQQRKSSDQSKIPQK